MEHEENIEQQKPSFKELLIGYKDKKTRPFIRFFNALYVITTILSYLYYVVYAAIHITKNGLDNPVSIMLLIAVIVYTIILVACAIMSSSFKTAKARIKRSMKVFKYLRRSITIVSSVVAITALVAAFKADTMSGWTIFVSIVSLIFNFVKVMFTLMMMGLSAGASALKFGTKAAVRHYKKTHTKKVAPEIESDATDNQRLN